MHKLSLSILGSVLFSASSLAQSPDAVVSNVAFDWRYYGNAGSVRAYSFGTTICNLGGRATRYRSVLRDPGARTERVSRIGRPDRPAGLRLPRSACLHAERSQLRELPADKLLDPRCGLRGHFEPARRRRRLGQMGDRRESRGVGHDPARPEWGPGGLERAPADRRRRPFRARSLLRRRSPDRFGSRPTGRTRRRQHVVAGRRFPEPKRTFEPGPYTRRRAWNLRVGPRSPGRRARARRVRRRGRPGNRRDVLGRLARHGSRERCVEIRLRGPKRVFRARRARPAHRNALRSGYAQRPALFRREPSRRIPVRQ